MRYKLPAKWLVVLLFSVLVPALVLSAIKVSGFLKEPVNSYSMTDATSNGNLFRSVWDNTVGMRGGYYLVSDSVFPLKVYVLNLPGVGNYRFSNHSDLIDGVRRAVEISNGQSQVKEFKFFLSLYGDFVAKLNVNISYITVEDWTTYRTVIESESNSIVVNTHDEFLPVPDGYSKEAWVDDIADFMLNRWGTWVHVGGYPFYRVWFQNGTQAEWGEAGFQRLMSHVGKGNATCYPPSGSPGWQAGSYDGSIIPGYLDIGFDLWPDWVVDCMPGYPLNLNYGDFGNFNLFLMFNGGFTSDVGFIHAAIRFSPNGTSFNFGVYVHLGTWEFQGVISDQNITRPAAYAGFLATAVAIYVDYSSLCKLYGNEGNSASEAILRAQNEGRTVGLASALALFDDALNAYAKGEYKMADSYATRATTAAQNATAPLASPLPVTVSALTVTVFGSCTGAYYYWSKKRRRKAMIDAT